MIFIEHIRRFFRCERGAVAIIVAVAMIPLLIAAGVAIDFVRAQQARTALQAAVDSAAMAAANKEGADQLNIQALVDRYLNQNSPGVLRDVRATATLGTNPGPTISPNDDFQSIVYTATAEMETTLLRVINVTKINIEVSAEAALAVIPRLDIVLVLDVSTSMNDKISTAPNPPPDSPTKLDTLKTAAQSLVNQLMIRPEAEDIVRIGVVPFAQYVRMPVTTANSSWFTIPPDITMQCNCRWTVPQTCRIETGLCDGRSCNVRVCSGGTMTCSTVTRSWSGCVGVRPQSFHSSISSPESPKYTGPIHCNPTDCGPTFTDLTTEKSAVTAAITNMITRTSASMGEFGTYLPGALTWGWNMLEPTAPLTNARPLSFMTPRGGKRVLILMTDGTNSYSPLNATGPEVVVNSASFFRNRGSNPAYPPSYANDRTRELCTGIKRDIEIYTIAFRVTDVTTKQLLEACAGSADSYYDAVEASDLINAFESIVKKLKQPRLVN
jgi:Flp pilus assembly protein TadG